MSAFDSRGSVLAGFTGRPRWSGWAFWARGSSFARNAFAALSAWRSIRARFSLGSGGAGRPCGTNFTVDAFQALGARSAFWAGGASLALDATQSLRTLGTL